MRTQFARVLRATWLALPERLRRSSLGQRLKDLVRGHAPAVDPAPMAETVQDNAADAPPEPLTISTLDELDLAMKQLEAAAAVSDDALRRGFQTFRMQAPLDLPPDPDSEEYRARQFEMYKWLHGKRYDVANEVSGLDPMTAADRPFPYLTGSAHTVGSHLIAIGYLIRHLDLAPGSRVLDCGPGWGNTTIALARMGLQVTALDIEPNFLALIDERARRNHLTVETIRGDFSNIGQLDRTFDAVLFFESFHHSANHQGLIAGLQRVVAPQGQVVFAGEPIDDGVPMPWGLRLDGESLWAIRRYGWLELGFREDYFRGLLSKHGWQVTKSVCAELHGATTGWGTIFTARRG